MVEDGTAERLEVLVFGGLFMNRPALIVWLYWLENYIVEQDAELFPPIYCEAING